MHLAIHHETVYRYASPVKRSTQYLRLTPVNGARQRVLQWELSLPAKASRCLDAYGNAMHVLTLDKPHSEIHLHASGVIETEDAAPQPDADDGPFPPAVFLRDSPLTQADTALRAFAAEHAQRVAADPMQGLLTLLEALALQMPYTPGTTDAATPAAEAFARHLGVCQDHAQVFATCARLLGIPTRYVSGYLAADAEHVASHAWAEVRLPGTAAEGGGWLGFDVSNQCLADARYVKLAIGLDYLDACPVRGMRLGGGAEAMQAAVQVTLAQGQTQA
ncbi:transglutaminase [Paucibacter sp. KBW04]|uniref:transglutaminase family protein n=1 Tax=Paucibacter sp. KBW04 TaxID=2153361 RepID=UPI000F580044|nr:transglutaminase family protein [Paucibacter sp. KBW04]RQO59919.1 transglutaminase [Paucibacter sp. KBW04]